MNENKLSAKARIIVTVPFRARKERTSMPMRAWQANVKKGQEFELHADYPQFGCWKVKDQSGAFFSIPYANGTLTHS